VLWLFRAGLLHLCLWNKVPEAQVGTGALSGIDLLTPPALLFACYPFPATGMSRILISVSYKIVGRCLI
jgi:hypothetical protein